MPMARVFSAKERHLRDGSITAAYRRPFCRLMIITHTMRRRLRKDYGHLWRRIAAIGKTVTNKPQSVA